jgi:methyl-accepting chemotaxis protein
VLDATREEAKGSDLVVRTIAAIQEVTNTNAAGVQRLDEMVPTRSYSLLKRLFPFHGA